VDCRIAIEDPRQPDIVALLAESDTYYSALYPSESNHLLDVSALTASEVTFLVARLSGPAAGFGALLRHRAEFGEIKRMYVAPATRGRSLGRLLLNALENHAHSDGLPCLRLETGIRQPEALALYRASGFHEIPPFGDYKPDPLSIFMEKRLT
jgi:putative acetyltransferase